MNPIVYSLLLVVLSTSYLQNVPFTVHLQDQDKKLVDAKIRFQTEPDKGREEFFVGNTNNGALAVPEKLIPKDATRILLLITPQNNAHLPRRKMISVGQLQKGGVVVIMQRDE